MYIFVYGSLLNCSLVSKDLSFDLIHLNNLYTTLKTNLPYFWLHVIVHITEIILSLVLVWEMCQRGNNFSDSVIKSTTDFYNCKFPYIKIKTRNGEIEGQLMDIVQNESLVTLKDKNILKIVPWDKIETMEVSPIIKNE